ncbi:MAG: hypothetical protein RLZZ141_614 [Pseudomonadota bacterium]
MFNKRAENQSSIPALSSAAEGGGRKSLKVASVIGDDVIIDGSVRGHGELHLDGTVRGDITVERLSIGETGQVEGTVTAETIDIRGKLTGTISAKQVKLYGTAHVDGDITHEQLSMEPGAYFQGRSLKFQRQITAPVHDLKASIGLDGFAED